MRTGGRVGLAACSVVEVRRRLDEDERRVLLVPVVLTSAP
jgi:hypothetical protein